MCQRYDQRALCRTSTIDLIFFSWDSTLESSFFSRKIHIKCIYMKSYLWRTKAQCRTSRNGRQLRSLWNFESKTNHKSRTRAGEQSPLEITIIRFSFKSIILGVEFWWCGTTPTVKCLGGVVSCIWSSIFVAKSIIYSKRFTRYFRRFCNLCGHAIFITPTTTIIYYF